MGDVAPGAIDAIEVVRAHTGWVAAQTRRLPWCDDGCTFEITPLDGGALVLRFGRSLDDPGLAGAHRWNARLAALGVPVAPLRASGTWRGLPYLLHERPAGTELASAYPRLRAQDKRALARDLVRVGRSVRALAAGDGFGFVTDERGPFPFATWEALVRAQVAGLGAGAARALLEAHLPVIAAHLAQVTPVAFLGGCVTDTALVGEGGALAGFVGLSRIAYGDPLHAVGRARAALAARGLDRVLTDFWCEELGLAAPARRAVDFYTALFAAAALAAAEGAAEPTLARLRRIVDESLATI